MQEITGDFFRGGIDCAPVMCYHMIINRILLAERKDVLCFVHMPPVD